MVFSALHGVGGVIIKPMLDRLGFHCQTVPEQDVPDGRFPTVKSPNPENAEALTMAMKLADETGADLVIATDPDCDRMGIAARDAAGKMTLLTGNQIGSLIAWYQAMKHFEKGILNDANKSHGVIIKTFVTTDLQKAIAEKSGIRCVETLTGFSVGEKLRNEEKILPSFAITTPTCQKTSPQAAVAAFLCMCLEVRKATAIAVQTSCATRTATALQ